MCVAIVLNREDVTCDKSKNCRIEFNSSYKYSHPSQHYNISTQLSSVLVMG